MAANKVDNSLKPINSLNLKSLSSTELLNVRKQLRFKMSEIDWELKGRKDCIPSTHKTSN